MARREAERPEVQLQSLQDLYDAEEEDEGVENYYVANEHVPGPAGIEEDDWAE